jgi:hypothetical protein
LGENEHSPPPPLVPRTEIILLLLITDDQYVIIGVTFIHPYPFTEMIQEFAHKEILTRLTQQESSKAFNDESGGGQKIDTYLRNRHHTYII